jgi:hypothetical protein
LRKWSEEVKMSDNVIPDFKAGDEVMLRSDAELPVHLVNFFHNFTALKGRRMTISRIYPLDNGKAYCSVDASPVILDIDWLWRVWRGSEPKFKEGDRVVLKKEVDSRYAAYRLCNNIYTNEDTVSSWQKRIMRIRGARHMPVVNSETQEAECFYVVNENELSWAEEWLEKIDLDPRIFKDLKPKFMPGDWVVLKEEIDSQKTAYSTSHNMYFDNQMLRLKKRFMKVNYVQTMAVVTKDDKETVNFFYRVNENEWNWHESWLEKVE